VLQWTTEPNAYSMIELSFPSRPVLCVTGRPETQAIVEQGVKGYRAVFASDAAGAIRCANSGNFDAYLIDYWLADWSGVQLCRHLREVDPNAPIVIFNGANQAEHRRRALRAGANGFFIQPLDTNALCTSLTTFLNISDHRSIGARVEEQRAVQEELTRQAEFIKLRVDRAKEVAVDANERIARIKAYRTFIDAGGMRSHFEKWWPQVYAGETKTRGGGGH
jgi:DNA-binding response OmpR family regulator